MLVRALSLVPLTISAAATAATPLPHAQWWEKVTVTVPAAGAEPKCTFTSSREGAKSCDIDASPAALAEAAPDKGQTTTITFERRFEPGAGEATKADIGPGEMLLGGQVMKIAIAADGKVTGCQVVEKADGGMEPDYGCKEATAEKFTAGRAGEGYLSILIYAHSEQVA